MWWGIWGPLTWCALFWTLCCIDCAKGRSPLCDWGGALCFRENMEETDPDDFLEVDAVVHTPGMPTGIPRLWSCPVCSEQLHSGLALEWHLHSLHPLSKCFTCEFRNASFNTAHQTSSHVANVHCLCKVACKECDYWTVLKAKMLLHVCIHTKGLGCSKCKKHFPSLPALFTHEHLHKSQEELKCDHCDKVYKTQTALHIHVVGKHGDRYYCSKYQERFDTPVQKVCHECKCLRQLGDGS